MSHTNLSQLLLREYGAVVGGRELRRVLGFTTAASFGRAVRAGRVPLRFLRLPGRRGRFALVSEIAQWLEEARETHADRRAPPKVASRREGPEM